MLKYIGKLWLKKPLGVILIIIGFFMAILFLSIGISVIHMNYESFSDKYSGDPEKNIVVHITSDSLVDFDHHSLSVFINKMAPYGDIQILNFGTYELKANHKHQTFHVVPVIPNGKTTWHVPMLTGRYFQQEDFTHKSNTIIVGKKVAKFFNYKGENNNLMASDNKTFEVVGTIGREYRQTQWDDIVYMPFHALTEKSIQEIDNKRSRIWDDGKLDMTLLLRKVKDMDQRTMEEMIQSQLNFPVRTSFSNHEGMDRSSLRNSIMGTTIIAGILLIISLVNVINLSLFWILERKKSLSIMNAIGATPLLITYWVIFEMVLMVVIASLLALMVHQCLWLLFKSVLIKNEFFVDVSYLNFLIVIAIGFLCGVISAVVPVKQALKIAPAEALKSE